MDRERKLRQGARKALWASVRLRFSDALRRFFLGLPWALIATILWLGVVKAGRLDWSQAARFALLPGTVLLVVLGWTVFELFRRRPKTEGSLALDRHFQLNDRLTNALSFWGIPSEKRTPLMELAIDQGAEVVDRVRVRKAVPIRFPPMVPLSLGLGAAAALVGTFELRYEHVVVEANTLPPVLLAADDIDYFRKSLKEMSKRVEDASVRRHVDEFNQLIEDVSARHIGRDEAFRRMAALDRKLRVEDKEQRKAFGEDLDRIAKELSRSDLTKGVAEALKKRDWKNSSKRLEELARKLRKGQKLRKARLERLRKALERASKARKQGLQSLLERRRKLRDEVERLLKKKRQGKLSEAERRLLKRKRRELERLERKIEAKRRAGRRLQRLDRLLAQAAADLAKQLGLSADDLDQGAQELNRMARQQMSQQEKQDLLQKLQELRELLRQQGRGGKVRLVRLRRFLRAAKGRRGRGGSRSRSGSGKGGSQGGQGKSKGKGKGEEVWVIGPDGKKILVFKSSSSSQPAAGGQDGQGKEPGTGHQEHRGNKPTNPHMGTQDVSADTIDSHKGPTRAEVIHGAADQGFVGESYQKVFTEYHTVAESALQREDVPPGYRFYVRRYFQLIRPREP